MRGFIFCVVLRLRSPVQMLSVDIFRALLSVDRQLALRWWRVSGCYDRCRRFEAQLRKIDSA